MRKNTRMPFAPILLAVAGLVMSASAQDSAPDSVVREQSLPTAKQINELMIEFSGGEDAFLNPMSIKSVGSFAVPMAQLKGVMTTWTAPPNLMRVDIDIPGLGTTKTGFNGTVGWTLDPTRGPSLMDGEMLDEIRRESDPAAVTKLLEYFDVAEITGRETFEGAECVVLRLEKGKLVQDRLVEEKTGRVVGIRTTMPTPMGDIPSVSIIEEWITIGPRKVPSKTVIKAMGMEQVMKIDKAMVDPIDAGIFALPPAIQALADARDAERKAEKEAADSSPESEDASPSGSSGEGR